MECSACGKSIDEGNIFFRAAALGDPDPSWLCMECRDKMPEEIIPDDVRDQLDAKVLYWKCSVDGCHRFNRVRDYGVFPWVIWRKRWVNVQRSFYLCACHWKQFKAGVLKDPEDPKPPKNNFVFMENPKASIISENK